MGYSGTWIVPKSWSYLKAKDWTSVLPCQSVIGGDIIQWVTPQWRCVTSWARQLLFVWGQGSEDSGLLATNIASGDGSSWLNKLSRRRTNSIHSGSQWNLKKYFISFLFIWLSQFSAVACGAFIHHVESFILVHGLWLQHRGSVVAAHALSCPTASGILIFWPGIKPESPALLRQIHKPWITREVHNF